MEQKIVFFDIDGTIYMYGKEVPEDTKEAIRELRSRGHLAVLCTGRTKIMVFPEIYEVGFDGIIAGAGTYVEFRDQVLQKYCLPKEFSEQVIRDMVASGIIPILEGTEKICFDTELKATKDSRLASEQNPFERYGRIYDLYAGKVKESVSDYRKRGQTPISKLSGMMTDQEAGKVFVEQYQSVFNIVYHRTDYIEMIPKDYSKAVGIRKLLEFLRIPIENTYAFGDGMNDYEMLRYVRYGIAMGNATEEFKKKVSYVTDAYDQGGISHALKKFGLIG